MKLLIALALAAAPSALAMAPYVPITDEPTPAPSETCVSPETEAECQTAVAAAGLSEGGCGFDFAGDYGSGRGCYTYPSGQYEGCGYWSTSGDPTGEPGGIRVRVCAAP